MRSRQDGVIPRRLPPSDEVASPDDPGLIVIADAPMSDWGSAWSEGESDDPMRNAGSLLGRTWLGSRTCDLGAGEFDGAWLVQNFEN
jgi:hypothetical protein